MREISEMKPLPKRVAFHFPTLVAGGVEKNCIVLSKEFLKLGVAVDFVLNRAVGDYLPQVPDQVRVIDLRARTITSVLPLRSYIRRERPDAVIANLGPQNIAAIIAGRTAGVPVRIFATQHNALGAQSRRMDWQQRAVPAFYRLLLPLADGIIAVSKGVGDDLSSVAGIKRGRITVIHNPAYPLQLEQLLNEPFSHATLQSDEPTIVGVGRLVDQKAFDVLIRAVAVLAAIRPVRLVIVGTGPLLDGLRKLTSDLDIAQRVEFVGFQANPYIFMKHASVVAMSSRYEGFGNVLVEAMACGTSVVSTNCDFGPAEILDNGKYGPLVQVNDVNAMADGIAQALASPIDPETLKTRALDFEASKVARRYLDLVS